MRAVTGIEAAGVVVHEGTVFLHGADKLGVPQMPPLFPGGDGALEEPEPGHERREQEPARLKYAGEFAPGSSAAFGLRQVVERTEAQGCIELSAGPTA